MTRPCIDSVMDSSRAMKMAAAAGDGYNIKVSTKESIAQDSSYGNDYSCSSYCLLVTNFFQSFVDAAVYRTSKLLREDNG